MFMWFWRPSLSLWGKTLEQNPPESPKTILRKLCLCVVLFVFSPQIEKSQRVKTQRVKLLKTSRKKKCLQKIFQKISQKIEDITFIGF